VTQLVQGVAVSWRPSVLYAPGWQVVQKPAAGEPEGEYAPGAHAVQVADQAPAAREE
jgi:hypothetical protein